ncbi:MAG: phosphoenolpyruvate--protein phosphotransferase [Acidobacteriota bacterium]
MRSRKSIGGASSRQETRIYARAVSRGIAVGKAVCLYGHSRQFYRSTIARDNIENEIKRLDSALTGVRKQLTLLSRKKRGNPSNSVPEIFDAHLMIVGDDSLRGKIMNEIESKRVNSEWATKTVIDQYVKQYQGLEDESLRERYIDVEDVGERIQIALGGSAEPFRGIVENSVIVSSELRPSTLVDIAESSPVAIITENGGWTSHTFIISRELNLPAVTGVNKLLGHVRDGDNVLVNGFTGEIIINPTTKTLSHHGKTAAANKSTTTKSALPGVTPKTLDGRQVIIRANADSPSVYARAKAFGAAGIGLFRSEYLYSRSKGFPTERDQIEAYSKIADAAGGDGVKIRTFDLNHDALVEEGFAHEKNPALGLRAVRMSLANPRELRTQLRAILIASVDRNIDIVVPMISGVAEMKAIATIIRKEKRNLKARNIPFGEPRLGAMIEVPSAVVTIDQVLKHVDFISLGTNDLVQYMLAVDRDNETVAEWFASLHPGVLRAIKTVIEAATAAQKELVICGEMAGSPYYIPVLVGLGARQLSMNVNSVADIRSLISGIAYEEARSIALECLERDTPAEVESVLNDGIRKKWGPLFPEHFHFPAKY